MSRILTPPRTTAGPTLTDGGRASCVPVSCPITLPAGFFDVGKWISLRMAGKLSSSILDGRGALNQAPGYQRFEVVLGGVVVWDGGLALLNPLVAFTDAPWSLALDLRCEAISDAGLATFAGVARFTSAAVAGMSATQPTSAGVALLPWGTPPAAGNGVNAFSPLVFDVLSSSGVNTGSRTVLQYVVEEL